MSHLDQLNDYVFTFNFDLKKEAIELEHLCLLVEHNDPAMGAEPKVFGQTYYSVAFESNFKAKSNLIYAPSGCLCLLKVQY